MKDMGQRVGEDTPKQKVLLSFVGGRDPYAGEKSWTPAHAPRPKAVGILDRIRQYLRGDVPLPDAPASSYISEAQEKWGSILTLCGEIQPNIVYLFPSCEKKNPNNNTEGKAREVRTILMGERPDLLCKILPLDIQDATDFEEISLEIEKKMDIIVQELIDIENYEFHLNCSSGTQQMTAVGYVLANSGRLPNIVRWQCKDPERLRSGEARTRRVNATFLEESVYRKKMEAGAERLAFLSVKESSENLSKIASSEKQSYVGALLAEVFNAYVLMDILRYQDAYVKLRDIERNAECSSLLNNDLKELLRAQVEALKELQGGSIQETPQNLVDLYYNMERCYERGSYADVMARFWRMGEGSIYLRLANKWGIDPRDRDNSPNKQNLALLKRVERYQSTGHRKEFIGFEGGRKALLEIFKDKDYIEMWEHYTKKRCYPGGKGWDENRIISLINKRNQTLVAHGMKPISEEDAKECRAIAEAMLLALVPDAEKRIEEYPFKKELIKKWVTLF